MTETTFKIRGLARYKRRLRAMPDAVAKHGATAAMRNAHEHRDAAKALVPERSGQLADTIKAYPVRNTKGTVWRVVAGNVRGKGFYARFQEFGTRVQPGSPFFFVAYRRLRARFKRRMSRAMGQAAKEVFGNGRG